MKKKKLVAVQQLKTGYGNYFGFHPGGRYWASASVGLLHVWDQFTLITSVAVPGYEKGNIVFTQDELIRIGLFELNFKSGKKNYNQRVAENFAFQIETGHSAHFSEYKIEEVLNFPDEDLLLVAIAQQPSKLLGSTNDFNGPGNRLLLFERSSGKLIRVIDENYEKMSYGNLLSAGKNICYTIDGLNCVSSALQKKGRADDKNELSQFIPRYEFNINNIVGSYKNKSIQIREAASLSLVRQLPFEFEEVNGVCSNDSGSLIFVGGNRNLLQCWNEENELIDSLSLPGTIEGMNTGKEDLCMVAVADTEYSIEVFSMS